MSDQEQFKPSVILAPDDFPVTWRESNDEQLSWIFENLHNPDQITQMDAMYLSLAWDDGGNRAAEGLAMPIRFRSRRINTYAYLAMVPNVPSDKTEAAFKQSEAEYEKAMGTMGLQWEREWIPEILKHHEEWDSFDLAGASFPDLAKHLETVITGAKRLLEIHMLAVLPAYVAMTEFGKMCEDLFEEESLSAARLIRGINSKTMEINLQLWNLSREALRSSEVIRILEERASDEVVSELKKIASGRSFLLRLEDYLSTYGQRVDNWELTRPAWIEDPTPVIRNLKEYIAQPDRDINGERRNLLAERERGEKAARRRIEGYPRAIKDRFEFLLEAARDGALLAESHGFWLDFCLLYKIRRVLMEVARRFVSTGIIDEHDHVFHLELDQIRAGLKHPGETRLQEAVKQELAELARFRDIAAPAALGTDYGPLPDNFISRVLGAIFGGPPQQSDDPGVIKGVAASGGKASGRAKIIKSISDADKLQKGDILVTESTAPPWTPLFGIAGAVVTDTGGVLSHSAVVAREYCLPAVVGTGDATGRLRDGQIVEVDGDDGVVRILKV